MPQVTISPPAKFSSEAATGTPLAGGKLFTYAGGTSTPLASYTDSTGNVANANPVILDARGEANVWLQQGTSYKYILQDSIGNVIYTVDNINAAPAGGFTQLFGDGTVTNPSVSFLNSVGMGLWRIANNILGIGTAGVEAMRIDASQNVGLGIAPTTKLDVNGTARFRSTVAVNGALSITTGGAAVVGNSSVVGTFGVTGDTTIAGGTFATRGFKDNYVGGTLQWVIDSIGRWTNPGQLQPSFAASQTSVQTSGTQVLFPTAIYNYGGHYNAGTSTFTAPIAGVYSFAASAQFANTTGGGASVQLGIVRSSTGANIAAQSFYASTSPFTFSMSVCHAGINLSAAETVTVVTSAAMTSTLGGTASGLQFSGRLLG